MVTAINRDRFGNAIDPRAFHASGEILREPVDEVQRMIHGRRLVRQRGQALGVDNLYNLTGVTRDFPITSSDLREIQTQLSFYTHFDSEAEPKGVAYAGGNLQRHDACFASRVSAGMLVTMLALTTRGQCVMSVVPAGHSHPSIRNACQVVGTTFEEVKGLKEAVSRISDQVPEWVVLTTVTPQKFVFDELETREIIQLCKRLGCGVIVDDAHMAVRTAYFRQLPVLALGDVDIALCSMDKHLHGPRAALIVGAAASIAAVRAQMYKFGLEAPFANYVASLRAIEGYDPGAVQQAGNMAEALIESLTAKLSCSKLYMAGPGVALSEEDLMDLAVERSGSAHPRLVPVELSSILAMRLVETSGLVTILAIGMPSASATMRLMMFPDGPRTTVETIVDSVDEALSFAAARLDDLDWARAYLCGTE